MVVIVHHLEKSRSHRIVWLLEELGIPYEIKKYERTQSSLAPKELRAVHPLGKSPVITDAGRTIAETGAITEYLVNKYGPQLAPPKSDEDLTIKYTYWLHFAEGTAAPILVISLIFSTIVKNCPWFLRPIANLISKGINNSYIQPNLRRNTAFMEAELAKNPQNWFVKDFSAADVVMSFVVELTGDRFGLSDYPHLQKYLATVHERPAYKRAEEKGGKLELVS